MNTLIDSDWGYLILSDFVDYAYYLGWGVIALVALCLVLKYIVQPCMANCHERKSKEKTIETEKYWHFQNELKHDYKKELEKKIQEKEKELQEEKNSREDKLKQERLQAEHDFYKKIFDDFYNKENL